MTPPGAKEKTSGPQPDTGLRPSPACGPQASPWIARFAHLVPPGAPVLDVACGQGRHSLFFLERGHKVTAVDIDISGMAALSGRPDLELVQADLEGPGGAAALGGMSGAQSAPGGAAAIAVISGAPRVLGTQGVQGAPGSVWPFGGRRFSAVVVVNYLWRPLFLDLIAAVAPGGVLLYDTFAVGQERHGRPRNPDHLLRPGELLEAVRGKLEVRAYEFGEVGEPPMVRQSLCAVRPAETREGKSP